MSNKTTKERREKKLKGQLCWLCGSEEDLTIHHLKCQPKSKQRRMELGTFLFGGECMPLCRECHIELELLQAQRKLLKNVVKTLKKAVGLIGMARIDELYSQSKRKTKEA